MKEKDNRPVYLNPLATDLPIIGLSSILHRISGFALFSIFLVSVWMLDRSLSSEQEFEALVKDLDNLFVLKLIFYLFFDRPSLSFSIGDKETNVRYFWNRRRA